MTELTPVSTVAIVAYWTAQIAVLFESAVIILSLKYVVLNCQDGCCPSIHCMADPRRFASTMTTNSDLSLLSVGLQTA